MFGRLIGSHINCGKQYAWRVPPTVKTYCCSSRKFGTDEQCLRQGLNCTIRLLKGGPFEILTHPKHNDIGSCCDFWFIDLSFLCFNFQNWSPRAWRNGSLTFLCTKWICAVPERTIEYQKIYREAVNTWGLDLARIKGDFATQATENLRLMKKVNPPCLLEKSFASLRLFREKPRCEKRVRGKSPFHLESFAFRELFRVI